MTEVYAIAWLVVNMNAAIPFPTMASCVRESEKIENSVCVNGTARTDGKLNKTK